MASFAWNFSLLGQFYRVNDAIVYSAFVVLTVQNMCNTKRKTYNVYYPFMKV